MSTAQHPKRLLTFLREDEPRMFLFRRGWRPLFGGPVVVWTDPRDKRCFFIEAGALKEQLGRESVSKFAHGHFPV